MSHGFVYTDDAERVTTVHAPFAALPTPVSRVVWQQVPHRLSWQLSPPDKVQSLGPLFNELTDKVARDHEFLTATLAKVPSPLPTQADRRLGGQGRPVHRAPA
jgi:hypothetical protein